MEVLKPCPFCGSNAGAQEQNTTGIRMWFVYCLSRKCLARVQQLFMTQEEALTAWNRRIP